MHARVLCVAERPFTTAVACKFRPHQVALYAGKRPHMARLFHLTLPSPPAGEYQPYEARQAWQVLLHQLHDGVVVPRRAAHNGAVSLV